MFDALPSRSATLALSGLITALTIGIGASGILAEPLYEMDGVAREMKIFNEPSYDSDNTADHDPWSDSAPDTHRGDDSSHHIPGSHPEATSESDANNPEQGNSRDCAHYDKEHANDHSRSCHDRH